MEFIITLIFAGLLVLILIFLVKGIRNMTWDKAKNGAKEGAKAFAVEAFWPLWFPVFLLIKLWIYIREKINPPSD